MCFFPSPGMDAGLLFIVGALHALVAKGKAEIAAQ